MATILPEGLYNANTYTITWDENEPAFYLIQDDEWLKNVGYFGLGTDAPGTNEGVVVVDDDCIRENLYSYIYEYNSGNNVIVSTPTFDTDRLIRYQVPSYHIDGKKMFGLGYAGDENYANYYNFNTKPTGTLEVLKSRNNVTETQNIDILKTGNVERFGWKSTEAISDFEQPVGLSTTMGLISPPDTRPFGYWKRDLISATTLPNELPTFEKVLVYKDSCVMKVFETNDPSVYGYVGISSSVGIQYFTAKLNNGDEVEVAMYRHISASHLTAPVTISCGVTAASTNPTLRTLTIYGTSVDFLIYDVAGPVIAYATWTNGSGIYNQQTFYTDTSISTSIRGTDRWGSTVSVSGTVTLALTNNAVGVHWEFDSYLDGVTCSMTLTGYSKQNGKDYSMTAYPYLNPNTYPSSDQNKRKYFLDKAEKL